jgi:hypothetical protein
MVKKKASDDGEKESKINQNIMIAIIGSITTIAVAVIPILLNRSKSEPPPTPVPLVITATSVPDFSTENLGPTKTLAPTETAPFTPTIEAPTATATPQVGIFNGFLASDIKGLIPKNKFKPAETIYLLFNINDPTGKNVVRIVWSVVEVKGYLAGAVKSDIPYIIKEEKFATLSNHSANPWAVGKYKVELYLNDVLDETIEFDIVP